MTLNNNLSILPFYKVTTADPTPIHSQNWWVYGHVYPLYTPGIPPIMIEGNVSYFELYRIGGGSSVGNIYPDGTKTVNGKVYTYRAGTTANLSPGRYQMECSISGQYYVSDIFTIVPSANISAYLKLEWWDNQDLKMDDGAIVYTNSGGTNVYKNVLYLATDLAKPDYLFTEDGESRDGYFFAEKQISEKRYRFAIFAPEYLLDVMRFIRLSDNIQITYRGQVYKADTFLMTPTWENNGDLASVVCEFTTNTVAKKIGRLITP